MRARVPGRFFMKNSGSIRELAIEYGETVFIIPIMEGSV
jgi:hypothetical protein